MLHKHCEDQLESLELELKELEAEIAELLHENNLLRARNDRLEKMYASEHEWTIEAEKVEKKWGE